jgi:hypothetical protein
MGQCLGVSRGTASDSIGLGQAHTWDSWDSRTISGVALARASTDVQSVAVYFQGRFRCKPDINRLTRRAGSVENDPISDIVASIDTVNTRP